MTSRLPERQQLDDRVFVACGLAWAAGLIHVKAAAGHVDESALYALLFAVVAGAQIAWGIVVYKRPVRALLVAGAVGSLAVTVGWVLSRTTGLPFGSEPWAPEKVNLVDAVASGDEVILACLVAAVAVRRPPAWAGKSIMSAALALLLLSTLLIIGPHVHG